MKIFHEVPLAMLDMSLHFNDGDYALVHKFEDNERYFNFYKRCVESGRHVILDNSVFELNKAFDPERFAYWIQQLKPTEYIIPDVLEDALGTMDNALQWKETYKNVVYGKSIGVVQGKTYTDLVACYEYLDQVINVDKIAFSFDYSYYQSIFPHPNKWVSFALGRVHVLSRMLEEGIINKNKPHHLLGCALPIEFQFYRGFEWIDSIDTSNPVVHGLLDIPYDFGGLLDKQSVKLVDLLESRPTEAQLKIILNNINIFRSFVKG